MSYDDDRRRALEVALYFRSLGLSPLPSATHDKQPTMKFRHHMQGEPIPDSVYHHDHWRAINIQMITGFVSHNTTNIVVIDCDGKEATHAWKRMCEINGQTRPFTTWKTRTGSGTGSHVYFRVPAGASPGRTRRLWGLWDTFGEDGKGDWSHHTEVKLLADGGLVIAPPSQHVDEPHNRYEFLPGSSPKEMRLPAFAPSWLFALPPVRTPRWLEAEGGSEKSLLPRAGYGHQTADRNTVLEAITDKRSMAEGWGLRTLGEPSDDGWLCCRAPNRADRRPSCGFNVNSGVIIDMATGESSSFFSLGVLLGKFATWLDCLNYCTEIFITR